VPSMMIADDRGVPKNTEGKVGILGAETVDRMLDKRLDFTWWSAGHCHPPAISHV
jgi:hypothetical protein